jgi:hypothetical protein
MSRVRTEYAELMAEQVKVERKLSAQGRAFSRWFPAKPEPDHFVWRDPFAGAPAIGEISE